MEQEKQAILVAIYTLMFLSAIIVVLFIVFQRRKNALLLEQKELEKEFEQEIAKTQIEIREEIFRNISWELHDNIGQLITLAKIQLQDPSNLDEVGVTLNKGLSELRSLSKLISPEALSKMKFTEAVDQEIERFNRLNFIKAQMLVKGEVKILSKETEIIFFRILQEFFSNTIKHAKARHLDVNVNYSKKGLFIVAKDDGQGFDLKQENNFTGIGLINIKNRALLVNAEVNIFSEPKKGTKLTISYMYE